ITRTFLQWRAAARHRVWLCALACTLLAPAVVVLTESIGWTLPIIPWTESIDLDEPTSKSHAFAKPNALADSAIDQVLAQRAPQDHGSQARGHESFSPGLARGNGD